METVPDQKTLAFWAENNFNVLFVGEHGIGKSAMIMDCFTRTFGEMNDKWLYFSGATLDPWVDFVGTPKEKIGVNGEPVLGLVRPEVWNDKIEAIFIDEFNRSHKKIRNAVMELIQFKSINGKKFPNLKVIWAAVNPHTEEEVYNVEALDPAQMDRFQIHVNLPYKPDVDFFFKKYDIRGKLACEWWNGLPENLKKMVSPRRLEYALQVHKANGNVRYVFDERIGFQSFVNKLNSAGLDEEIKKALQASDNEPIQDLFNKNLNNKEFILRINKPTFFEKVVPRLSKEQIAAKFQDLNSKSLEKIAPQPEIQKLLQEVRAAGLLSGESKKTLEKMIIKDLKELENICKEILTIPSLTKDTQARRKQVRRIIRAISDVGTIPPEIRKIVEEVFSKIERRSYGGSSIKSDLDELQRKMGQLNQGSIFNNSEEIIDWDNRGKVWKDSWLEESLKNDIKSIKKDFYKKQDESSF